MAKKKPAGGMREAFEDKLAALPEDLATHMAYADWLVEQGDPRGEFIQVQLALERAKGTAATKLRRREEELLAEHRSQWLGDLADIFPVLEDRSMEYNFVHFRRGWVDDIQVFSMREGLARELAKAPQLRLIRRLAVIDADRPEMDLGRAYRTNVLAGAAWFEEDEEKALKPLLKARHLGNLRSFQLGDAEHERCDVGDGPVWKLIQKMPKLEELRLFLWRLQEAEALFAGPLPHLRLLHVGGVFGYPLEALAANESLSSLRDLLIQPAAPEGHSKLWPDGADALLRSPHLNGLESLSLRFLMAGDVACQALVEGGALGRLKSLDLQYGEITDEGAALLAEDKGVGRLERLDLRGNRMTEKGVKRLKAACPRLVFDPQLGPEDESDEGFGISF